MTNKTTIKTSTPSVPRAFMFALGDLIEEMRTHKQVITLFALIGYHPDDKRCRVLNVTGLMCAYGDIEDMRMTIYGKLVRLCREHGIYVKIICGSSVKSKIKRLWPSTNVVVHSHMPGVNEHDVMLHWSCTIPPF